MDQQPRRRREDGAVRRVGVAGQLFHTEFDRKHAVQAEVHQRAARKVPPAALHDAGVGLEVVASFGVQSRQVRRADLLLALDEELQAVGEAAADLQKRPYRR